MRALLPKKGALMKECEDAIGVNVAALRFAVADGATEAYGARRWARYLVTAWVSDGARGADEAVYGEGVGALARRFQARQPRDRAPWYVEAKAQQGSFAALLGLTIAPATPHWTWEATAIGDCCLIHLRSEGTRMAFPIADPKDFGSHPVEIGTMHFSREALAPIVRREAGALCPGDVLLLMTDAIAQWYLEHCAPDGALATEFDHAVVSGITIVAGLVNRERAAGRLRNDDVAILKIGVNSHEEVSHQPKS